MDHSQAPLDQPADQQPSGKRPTTSRKRAIWYGAAAAVAGASLFVGAGIAAASTPTTASAGSGGWRAQISCDNLSSIQDWISHRVEVIGSDATVQGSTAWVQQELAAAQAAGNTDRAARLQRLLDARAAHPDHWKNVAARLAKVQDTRCS